MKQLLKDIIIVLLLFLGFVLPLEFFVFPYLSNNVYNYKCNYVENNSERISILLMGNSYFANSIDPSLLGDSVFDMAIEGRWIYYDKELMKRYVPQMQNLKTIIFPMGYKMPFQGSHHYSDNISIDYCHEKFMKVWYDNFPENFFRFLYVVHGISSSVKLFSDNVYCNSMGYSRVIGHHNSNWRQEQNISSDIIYGQEAIKQVKEYCEYLKEMAAICNQNGVRFIVVTPPFHDSFNANVKQEGVEILHELIDNVRNEYPIEYKDYIQDDEFRADSIYYNCSHLNSIGAELFALRVKKDFGL